MISNEKTNKFKESKKIIKSLHIEKKDIVKFLRQYGIVIYKTETLKFEKNDYNALYSSNPFKIWISMDNGLEMNRYIITHIFFLFLNNNSKNLCGFFEISKDMYLEEESLLAREFLLPLDIFIKEFNALKEKFGTNVLSYYHIFLEISKKYKVPFEMVEIRNLDYQEYKKTEKIFLKDMF